VFFLVALDDGLTSYHAVSNQLFVFNVINSNQAIAVYWDMNTL
jgi:hypothetical protein